jgi:hypothetical protein
MPSPLDEWQKHLENHFEELATARNASQFPLFALEHGLHSSEIDEIGRLLRARIEANLWLDSHWLVWTVYATEFGYDYDGDEYWPSFEDHTPRWSERGSRNKLRGWFEKFRETYDGVAPSGQWADWFTIISWPITHAILPKFLQEQFAKTLYELRYRLASLDELDPKAIGKAVASNAWQASSRFREFLQQEELAGRIVLALVGDRNVDGPTPIYLPTLQRLVSDMEKAQNAREWLKETRRFVTDRFTGTSPRSRLISKPDADSRAGGNTADGGLNIRPRLLLRQSGTSSWSMVVEIPDLSGFARMHPEFLEFLATVRCQIAGIDSTWFPGGWLLTGTRRPVLRCWPPAGLSLLRFERPNPSLQSLIDADLCLPHGAPWLFRVQSDGIAREILGKNVRPGQTYIIISQSSFPEDTPHLTRCTVHCQGVNAAILALPGSIGQEASNHLEKLGLEVVRTVRIWPAGLPARTWDGEGNSEWLTTETPCFGVLHDHAVNAYTVRLDDEPDALLKTDDIGKPCFLRLPPLSPGQHLLSIRVHRGHASSPLLSPTTAERVVTLNVRNPEVWTPSTNRQACLVVSVDPINPSLDEFWEDGVDLTAVGPVGRRVTCRIDLTAANGKKLLSDEIGDFDLPLTPHEWRKKLSSFLDAENRALTYLEASRGRLHVTADELGTFSLSLEREARPIRWICRSPHHRQMIARLVDDTGRTELAQCHFFSFRLPMVATNVDIASALEGLAVQPPGGLFIASNGNSTDGIIVSASQIEKDFRDLLVAPDPETLNANVIGVMDILKRQHSWTAARVAGPLATMRKARVLQSLSHALYERLCGNKWVIAESTFTRHPDSPPALEYLQRLVARNPGFAALLRREYGRLDDTEDQAAGWFAAAAERYGISKDSGLAQFALRLANKPLELVALPPNVIADLLNSITRNNELLRGARFLVLLHAAKSSQPRSATTETMGS